MKRKLILYVSLMLVLFFMTGTGQAVFTINNGVSKQAVDQISLT